MELGHAAQVFYGQFRISLHIRLGWRKRSSRWCLARVKLDACKSGRIARNDKEATVEHRQKRPFVKQIYSQLNITVNEAGGKTVVFN